MNWAYEAGTGGIPGLDLGSDAGLGADYGGVLSSLWGRQAKPGANKFMLAWLEGLVRGQRNRMLPTGPMENVGAWSPLGASGLNDFQRTQSAINDRVQQERDLARIMGRPDPYDMSSQQQAEQARRDADNIMGWRREDMQGVKNWGNWGQVNAPDIPRGPQTSRSSGEYGSGSPDVVRQIDPYGDAVWRLRQEPYSQFKSNQFQSLW